MERYTIELRDEASSALREAADAKGLSIEQELSGLVERTYAKRSYDDWVHELIAMTRPGVDFRLPDRLAWERQIPFDYHDFS